MNATTLINKIENNAYNEMFASLYQDESKVEYQKERYTQAIRKFIELYGDLEVEVYSAAGRSEVSGNHTDHQLGRVLAASINLDTIAIVSRQPDLIEVVSDNFEIAPVRVDETEIREEEFGTSEALIRGVAAGLKEAGYNVGGFKAYMTSDVLVGAGLSSSASFEVAIGTILSGLYNDDAVSMVEIAKISQMAENQYFGKPCGLMDQCACAVGGLITIDFANPENPDVRHVDTDFSKFGYSLCIVDTKGSHADLTHEYAAIPQEMKAVASVLGADVLSQVSEEDLYANLNTVRQACGDRAVLRAIHFFNETNRVPKIVQALEQDDFEGFLQGIKESGNSSFKFLQNVYAADRKSVV